MGLHKFRPTTSALRHTVISDFSELTKSKPEKNLLTPLKKSGGRNSYGRVTLRFRGGGHKRMYRLIDFKRDRVDVPAKVLAIEYDPNRSARIALIEYPDKARAYILAPLDLKVGSEVISTFGADADIRPGNCMPIENIPLGTAVHNIELNPGQGGQIVRSAGAAAQIMAKEEGEAHLRLPSSEVRRIKTICRATIGQIGNVEHDSMSLGKAGRSRWLGRRGKVRGVAMNPVDHPMGGGEGRSSGGRHPCTPWGKPTKGFKTRRRKKQSSKWIVRRRP